MEEWTEPKAGLELPEKKEICTAAVIETLSIQPGSI
jgi:hypothetical protein